MGITTHDSQYMIHDTRRTSRIQASCFRQVVSGQGGALGDFRSGRCLGEVRGNFPAGAFLASARAERPAIFGQALSSSVTRLGVALGKFLAGAVSGPVPEWSAQQHFRTTLELN